jgi:hypothetical protein
MVAVAALTAVAIWLLLVRVVPAPVDSGAHNAPGPDWDHPLVSLRQFDYDGHVLPFGARATTDQVDLEVSGVPAGSPLVISMEREGIVTAMAQPQASSQDAWRHRLTGLAPGTYSWAVTVEDAAPAKVRRYPAPSPSFVVGIQGLRLEQADHRRQPLARGGQSERGFNAGVHIRGNTAEADVEIKPEGVAFNEAGITTLQVIGGTARVWLQLSPGSYVWRARARIDGQLGPWTPHSNAEGPDFEIVSRMAGVAPQADPRQQPQPPPRPEPSPPQPAPGSTVSSNSGGSEDEGGGGGRSRPRPSITVAPPTLWALLTPSFIAVAATLTGLLLASLAVYVRWRGR